MRVGRGSGNHLGGYGGAPTSLVEQHLLGVLDAAVAAVPDERLLEPALAELLPPAPALPDEDPDDDDTWLRLAKHRA